MARSVRRTNQDGCCCAPIEIQSPLAVFAGNNGFDNVSNRSQSAPNPARDNIHQDAFHAHKVACWLLTAAAALRTSPSKRASCLSDALSSVLNWSTSSREAAN